MSDASHRSPPRQVTPEDIESKLRELQGDVGEAQQEAVNLVVAAGAALVAVGIVVAFWLGRRRGRGTRTVVEIRRV